MSEISKSVLMRYLKDDLLEMAEELYGDAVNEEMTKDELADAILAVEVELMEDSEPPTDLTLVDSPESGPVESAPSETAHMAAPGDEDYPKSTRVKRIEASQNL